MMLKDARDFDAYPNFSRSEFVCRHTGKCEMHKDLLNILQSMRDRMNAPIFISSGYRDPSHPVEAMKDKPGEHTEGMAVDIICYGDKGLRLLYLAQQLGITRIGLHQKGRASGRFMHIGIADKHGLEFPVGLWTY